MPLSDHDCFQDLKSAVEKAYVARHPACRSPIQEWKGQEIVDFQEDLMAVVQGRISEKWFYTHIRAQRNEKLPRIDMLNMLGRYAGYKDWQGFLYEKNSVGASVEREVLPDTSSAASVENNTNVGVADVGASTSFFRRRWWVFGAAALALLTAVVLVAMIPRQVYTFCFVDADRGLPIRDQKIDLTILITGESPIYRQADAKGCFSYQTGAEEIQFVVTTPYYKADTIRRRLDKDKDSEQILLRTDDYALMIHLFSNSKIKDWKKRRAQLADMLSEDAEIFQLSEKNAFGMELYTREEFIDKMTMPVKSLRNIEVLDTRYDDEGRIIGMRFVQKEKE